MKDLPNKIYLNLGDLTEDEFNETNFKDLSEVTWSEDDVQGMNVEYVRKDAFIEKACKFLAIYQRGFVTHKDIVDFKNYMKGE